MKEISDLAPDEVQLLLRFAHEGAVYAIADAEKRLMVLREFGQDAILDPPLHNFTPERQRPELSAEKQNEYLRNRIEEAKRVGMLCEQFTETENAG